MIAAVDNHKIITPFIVKINHTRSFSRDSTQVCYISVIMKLWIW